MTTNLSNNNHLDFSRLLTLIFIMFSCFMLFIIPIKLGSPYIDELGLFVPTLIDLIFSSWPTLALCTLALLLILIMASHVLLRPLYISELQKSHS